MHFHQLILCAALPLVAFATDAAGKAFLEANAKKEGVVVLASGLQYTVLKGHADDSARSPGISDPCLCNYEGTLIDGTVFDSSWAHGRPITFAPNQVIKGWTEALQLMKAGDRWKLFIPSELAYGKRGSGRSIPPESALLFELELISVAPSLGSRAAGMTKVFNQPLWLGVPGWLFLVTAVACLSCILRYGCGCCMPKAAAAATSLPIPGRPKGVVYGAE
ncbi:unnamed protein product [Polarella glacialis]|uniref:peptidylprolyl isomerase n=1 Tax=Polarella glacialis TaxID=89957 RepID=A0A813E8X4_POLGL|nr:unnamed protein product [Polarella glacialis]CAE8710084.1 unnamed protein product [Polarella glacialis]